MLWRKLKKITIWTKCILINLILLFRWISIHKSSYFCKHCFVIRRDFFIFMAPSIRGLLFNYLGNFTIIYAYIYIYNLIENWIPCPFVPCFIGGMLLISVLSIIKFLVCGPWHQHQNCNYYWMSIGDLDAASPFPYSGLFR